MGKQQQRYVGIHPDKDFGLIPKGKNSDVIRLSYGNVAGIPAKWITNNTVNAIRCYAHKHDLDAFFGVEANLNWTRMPEAGRTVAGTIAVGEQCYPNRFVT